MKVLTNIDMNKNEVQNIRLHNVVGNPNNLVKGQMWIDTTNNVNKVKYYDGTNIITLGEINFETSTSNIKMNGTTASVGSLNTVARADHIHPSDTSRVPTTRTINGLALSSNITLTGQDILLEPSLNPSTNDTIAEKFKAFKQSVDPAVDIVNHLLDQTSDDILAPVTQDLSEVKDTVDTLGDAAFLDVSGSISSPGSTSTVPTCKAVVDYVSSAAGAVDAMRFKGTVGTGGTVTTLPTSGVNIGDTYRVITASTYAGQVCEVGDLIIAITATPTWTVAQTNIDGAITSITGTSPVSVTGSGSSRTISVSNATTATAGLMSSYDKSKLNRLRSTYMYTVYNPALTSSGGVCYWVLDGAEQQALEYAHIDIYDEDGNLVLTDVNYTYNSFTISIISESNIPANKYSAIITGMGW